MLTTKKESAKLRERLRILELQQERLEDEVLEAQVLAERNGLEVASVKEHWHTTIFSRVQTRLVHWAFVSWSTFVSMHREDARRDKAEREVRQSMKQFNSQVATMRSRLDSYATTSFQS